MYYYNKIIFASCLTASVIFFSWQWFTSESDHGEPESHNAYRKPETIPSHSSALATLPPSTQLEDDKSDLSKNVHQEPIPPSTDQDAPAFTHAEVFELENWREYHGIFPSEQRQTYESYDEVTLLELVRQGDLLAMYVLEKLYLDNELEYEKAMEMIDLGIIYGSSYAFISKGQMVPHKTYVQKALKNEPIDYERDGIIEEMAYYQAALNRGNPFAIMVGESFIDSYHLTFTDEQIQKILKRSNELYNAAEEKREQLGLDPFDNSMPPSVEKYFLTFYDGFNPDDLTLWMRN